MLKNNEVNSNTTLIMADRILDDMCERLFRLGETSKIEEIKQKRTLLIKAIHDGNMIMDEMCFDNDFQNLGTVGIIDHGLRKIMGVQTGSPFNIAEAKKVFNLQTPGIVLQDSILKKQIPGTRMYDDVLRRISSDTQTDEVTDQELQAIGEGIIQVEGLYKIFKGNNEALKAKTSSILLQVVRDIDTIGSAEYLLAKGKFASSDDPISKKVWESFKNGKIDVIGVCREGKWNPNIKTLIHLSFINRIRLYESAMLIKEQGLISKLEQRDGNPQTREAYAITKEKLDLMLQDSNGITVDAKRIRLTK